MEYLLKSDILHLNKRTIEAHGGNFTPPYNSLITYILSISEGKITFEEIKTWLGGNIVV
jgi:hypothetical protein